MKTTILPALLALFALVTLGQQAYGQSEYQKRYDEALSKLDFQGIRNDMIANKGFLSTKKLEKFRQKQRLKPGTAFVVTTEDEWHDLFDNLQQSSRVITINYNSKCLMNLANFDDNEPGNTPRSIPQPAKYLRNGHRRFVC